MAETPTEKKNGNWEIVLFVPRMGVEARVNILEFVNLVRDKILAFGKELPWDEDIWDITEYLPQKRGKKQRQVFSFMNFDTAGKKGAVPMARPFLHFAKAYMRYGFSLNKRENHAQKLAAVRAIENVLSADSVDGMPRVENTTPDILNRAAQVLQRKNPGSAFQSGCHLELLARFLNENHMVTVGFSWVNPIPRKKDLGIGIGQHFDQRRKTKLPSQAALGALPQIFYTATAPVDIIISSMAAILLCAPDRYNELYALPVHCEHEDRNADGSEVYGLKWEASKGGGPQINWIPSEMVDVCKMAIQNLQNQTAEARRMAKSYEDNPGRLYLPPDLEYLRRQEFICSMDLSNLLGINGKDKACRWARERGIDAIKARTECGVGAPRHAFRFVAVENAIIDMLPRNFPTLDTRTGLRYSEALFILPHNFFHPRRGSYRCLFQTISINDFNNQLGAGVKHNKSSIFSRNSYTEPDGNPIKLTSHQFRHFLTNLALKKNLGYLVATLWRKSKNLEQTRAYDHRTPEDFIGLMTQGQPGDLPGQMVAIPVNTPVSRKEFLDLMFPCVHTTQFGFCVHDWQLLPCQRGRDCLNCTSHVCIKGDQAKTERIRQELKDAEEQLARDLEAVSRGELGSDRWVASNQKKVARLSQLVGVLDDPTIAEGTIIQLHNENEFSFIGLAIDNRRQLDDSDAQYLSQIRARGKADPVEGDSSWTSLGTDSLKRL